MQQMDSGKLGAYCFESITYNELNEPSRVNTEFQFWLRQELKVCFQAHYHGFFQCSALWHSLRALSNIIMRAIFIRKEEPIILSLVVLCIQSNSRFQI